MAKYKIYVTDDRHGSYEIESALLAGADAEVIVRNCSTESEIAAQCADADGLLLNLAPCGKQVMDALHRCKVINRYGVGCDNVDIDAATARGIQVTNVPDYCVEDVSDHALALMLACLRQVALRDSRIRTGGWNIPGESFRLRGSVLGILGFGRIAQCLARKCSGFGFTKILVYDPYVSEEQCGEYGAIKAELKTVLEQADLVSLHMPVTEQTRGMINGERISWMKPNAILINTARGQLIEDDALIAALKEGRILAAGLDTHRAEPLPRDSEYFALDNVVLTDHSGYNTVEAVRELKIKSAQNIADVLLGRPPKYAVNQPVR